jgi:hypothetical protein
LDIPGEAGFNTEQIADLNVKKIIGNAGRT